MTSQRVKLAAPLAAAVILATSLQAAAEDPTRAQWWPSQYGADDRLGAINHLSRAGVRQAAELVRTGETYALGVVTGPSTPAYPPRQFSLRVTQPGDGTGAPQGANRTTGNDDWMLTWMGIGSQIDGLGHIGRDHRYYNGLEAEEFIRPTGLLEFGTHELPPIVTRGVLLDMTHGTEDGRLAGGTAFNRAEIQAAAARQGIEIRKGDVVLFHTGWLPLAESEPERFIATQPGLGVEGARYLAERGVVAVGADTAALEAIPHEDPETAFPVHQELLTYNGVYILENMNTGPLAQDAAWEFMFVLGQPRFEGAVQAIINPVAIR